ncbi:hypothetical protein WN48_07701 [Eufriesea mexicana]|uniref:Uncharacterized protein n=1 Tax=Eufriesea mexicana TaxID=516756 RepID=A0A310SY13_9HYME|nr:hypothetical protein WN48_07701 [Eufriesea mexicana]
MESDYQEYLRAMFRIPYSYPVLIYSNLTHSNLRSSLTKLMEHGNIVTGVSHFAVS